MRVSARRIRVRMLAVVVGALVTSTALCASPAFAEEPLFVPWSDLLPSFTTGYDPSSANDCTSGKIKCVDAVIREMDKRFKPLARDCDHNAVFARYYFDAWDDYRNGRVSAVSTSWQIAFDAADRQTVSGIGNLLLGMSAHVNRDLPMVLADIGLVKPDGSSRKPDHDKVNQFLNLVMEPLIDEVAARFDPTVDDSQIDGTTLDEAAMLQMLVGWREQDWRNAEALVNAPTPAARALVQAEIERVAAIEANLIVVATGYRALDVQAALSQLSALGAPSAATLQAQADRNVNQQRGILGSMFTSGAAVRNAYCDAHG